MKATFKKMPTHEKKTVLLSRLTESKRVLWVAHRRYNSYTFFN